MLPNGRRWEAVRSIGMSERFATLIKTEVERSQLKHEEIEKRIGLESGQLYRWENAIESPQANKFYETILFLGPRAYGNASMLWTDIQFELYEILSEKRAPAKRTSTVCPLNKRLNFEALGTINRLAA